MKNFQKAVNAFSLEKNEEAWVYLTKSIEKSNDNYYQPLIYAGDRSTKEGNFTQALSYYDASLLKQVISSTYLKKSRVEKYLYRWDDAIADLHRYLEIARLTNDRRKLTEQELRNLQFGKESYLSYLDNGGTLEVKKLPFSDHKMEYFPCITGDGKTLYFTARDLESKKTDENLFNGFVTGPDWSSRSAPLIGALNSPGNEGAATISADGNTMVFTACDRPDGKGSCDLYTSTYQGSSGWGRPMLLKGKVNTPAWESQPSLGPDGTSLYFVRGSSSQSQNHDIFVAHLGDNGAWNNVQRLPRQINTGSREGSPFIHFDGETLYFSSERSPSLGGSDFFKSTKINDTAWTTPVNLGFPVNGFSDEFSLVIDHTGTTGYFASNREGLDSDFTALSPDLDLYEFSVPLKIRPSMTSYVNATVIDEETNMPIGSAKVSVTSLTARSSVFNGFSSLFTGEIRPMLQPGNTYSFTASKDGYLPYSNQFVIDEYADERLELRMRSITKGASFILQNIFFSLDNSELRDNSLSELNALFTLLDQQVELSAIIIGHTDNQGSVIYNQELSEDRAEAVKNWLVEKGIDPNRLRSAGQGLSEPVATNDTDKGRAQNRRTEVVLN